MKLLLYCLLAMLWPVGQAYAQNQATNIRPLTVGDTVPPGIVIDNVVNYPASKIYLSDLKGKLVILDFWGKYCAPCILALHKLDSLQNAYKGKIQIITISDFDNAKDLTGTLNRFQQTKNLNLPVVLGDQQMAAYFPYKLVSHLVWIDEKGVVKAITSGEYITGENVSKMLSGSTINWPLKKDITDFDYKKTLLDFVQTAETKPSTIFYSAFTSYMAGIAPPNGSDTDTSQGISIVRFFNTSLLDYIKIAIDYNTLRPTEDFKFEVADKNKYIRQANEYKSEWRINNTYCYYLQIPLNASKDQIRQFVQADIIRWLQTLGITVRKNERTVKKKKTTFYTISETRPPAYLK